MENIQDLFLDYLINKKNKITNNVIEKAKECYFDYLGVTIAGAKVNLDKWGELFYKIPNGDIPLIGYDKKTNSQTACLINGFNSHSLELDDGSKFAMMHLGTTIITALYTAKIENGISDKKFYEGIIIGYETACRLSLSIQPSHKKLGFHTTGTIGTIASSLAVAFALNMSKEKIKRVISCATTSSSGLLRIQEEGSELKAYNSAHAAMAGLSAVYMGFTNYIGNDDILGGGRGFVNLFSDGCNVNKLVEQNSYFEIERIYVKNYAACQYCHSPIECALNIRNDIDVTKIDSIKIFTSDIAIKGHNHQTVESITSAKLSIPFCVAVAFIVGNANAISFNEENINRKDIIELTKKIEVKADEEFSNNEKLVRSAKIEVIYNDGKTYKGRVEFSKGTMENPMTMKDIENKIELLIGKKEKDKIIKKFIDKGK